MPIFRKNPCIICNNRVGAMSSHPTADGNRLCFDCMNKMGLKVGSLVSLAVCANSLRIVEHTSDADLIARFRNPPPPEEQAELEKQANEQMFCIICEQRVRLQYYGTADGYRICFDCVPNLGFQLAEGTRAEIFGKTSEEWLNYAQKMEEQSHAELESGIRTIGGIRAYFHLLGLDFQGNDSENFHTLVDNLSANEEILVPFSGRYDVSGEALEDTAFALTNRRFIYASHAGIVRILMDNKPSFLKKLRLEEILDAGFKGDSLFIDTMRGKLTIRMKAADIAKPIAQALRDCLDDFAELAKQPQVVFAAPPAAQVDVTEELRKFKQLEIDGIITAEEFELKKRQLLGI